MIENSLTGRHETHDEQCISMNKSLRATVIMQNKAETRAIEIKHMMA